ncbi:MAG: isoleucine--tRNA ligase [Halobacteriales archaeon]|nr:isoleucine--tRNA ligase [Halobacteriales archaeon]
MEIDDELSERYDPHDVEPEVKEYWDEEEAYEKAKEAHADDPNLYFLDGPPYTSGQMHLGTAWNKTLKDAVVRYLRMRGHNVTDRPGYDMHGLPIEVKVEERLGFENKGDIEEFGVENFIDECKEFANDNLDAMNDDFRSMGVWMDWENPYRTLSPEYMEGAWWAFDRAYDRGLVEKGQRVVNQCPRCETSIADAEVEYEDIESPSIYVKFPLVDEEGSLVIWTTTPWTIPANLYIAVDSEAEYAKVRAVRHGDGDDEVEEEEVLYVASDCVEDVLRAGRYDDYDVRETFDGSELVGRKYTHPLEDEVPKQRDYDDEEGVHEVYTAEFVTTDRTGLVHAAPGHGVDDFEVGQENDLPVFAPVGPDGKYTDDAGEYAGTFVRDANPDVIEDLRDNGALLAEGTQEHRYGHCWRCDTPIIFTATDQWFITVTDVKDRLLEEIEESVWYPDWARDSRFRDWVENARDWNVSRQRYWGIPVPIWETEDGDRVCVGTREELAELALDDIDPDNVDLHRPDVDDIVLEHPGTGERAYRVEDIFDVWLDSAAASWAALDYPSKKDDFEELWPADLIIEAHDQTRGWFWSQLGMGVSALDEIPYHEVVMHGHALDEDGRKMSKSVGNIVTPQEAIDRHGVDPLRCFLLSHDQQGDDMRFSWDEIEAKKRTLNVVWNTYRFPLPYMRLDGFDPDDVAVEDAETTVVDNWVLSRLQTVEERYAEQMDGYEIDKAQKVLLDFLTEDVSRFYVQVVRPRMWDEEDSPSKNAAYATLYAVLEESTRMLAPFAPHLAERMYENLGDVTTVHALDFPEADDDLRDETLERRMDVLRKAEEATANARQQAERKLRWPVKRVIVSTEDEDARDALDALEDLYLDRVNAKSLEVVDEYDELVEVAEPQMGAIGPEFGEDAEKVMNAVRGARRDEVEDGVEVDGETVTLDDEMVEYRDKTPENVESAEFEGGTVYVDVSLDDEIRSEGYARELVRRVQEMRKELDLDVEQRIRVSFDVEDDEVLELAMRESDYVLEETRADEIADYVDADLSEDWDVEGVEVRVGVEVANV